VTLSESRVLKIFVYRRDKVRRGWNRIHENIRNFLSSPNGFKDIKPRIMRRAELIARMGGG
jgi:hypothetical protein